MPLRSQLGKWIRTDLGVRTFQGLGKSSPSREQAVRRITRDFHTHRLVESLDCEIRPRVPLHRRCLPGCGHATSLTRDIYTCFLYRLQPRVACPPMVPPVVFLFPFSSLGGGGGPHPFQKLILRCVVSWDQGRYCRCSSSLKMLKRDAQTMFSNLK